MLGYIRPYNPELKMREYQYYRGVYCGLCRAMGRCTGQCSRLALSYDFVFLALTRLALAGGNPQREQTDRAVRFESRRCLVHPLRRRLSLAAGDVTDYVACAAAILNYHKILDDCTDERGWRRLRARLALPHLRRFAKRAKRTHPDLEDGILAPMRSLAAMEQAGLPSADEPADAFGEALAALFCYGLSDDKERIARHIGHRIGRWLYLVDAIDDYEQDKQRGRPNPLHRLYGEDGLTNERREHLRGALACELGAARDALDLIDVDEEKCGKELSPLLYHILDIALPAAAERVLFPNHDPKKNKKASSNA
ncbi:MAG: hypothetical protein J6R04_06230 [Clostridia bacterium]|nr:hypothetical protein [Clostridia bacterium]